MSDVGGDLGTVYVACKTALGDGTASWLDRVWADFEPNSKSGRKVIRPYVTYGYSAGGDANRILKSDPSLLFDIVCVADNLADALKGAEEIKTRLDDRGEMERIKTVVGDSQYAIKTITAEMRIHFVEQVSGATQIYHSGAKYRWQLEKR